MEEMEEEEESDCDLAITTVTDYMDIWSIHGIEFHPYNSSEILPFVEPGDEIWLKRNRKAYSHVLLYIGDGEVIHISHVHKTRDNGRTSQISRDKLEDIAVGQCIAYRKTKGLNEAKRNGIVKRAEADVGLICPYILTLENCEHQVRYWIYGRKGSTQIKDYCVICFIAGMIGGILAAILIGLILSAKIYWIAIGFILVGILSAGSMAGFKYWMTSKEHQKLFTQGA